MVPSDPQDPLSTLPMPLLCQLISQSKGPLAGQMYKLPAFLSVIGSSQAKPSLVTGSTIASALFVAIDEPR
jgi:hypothetical protein